jgi:methylphosphotriester-DNA--protein-cysteine methyltransferase
MTDSVALRARTPTEISMRQAIAVRDAAFDGVFVYRVITTGVYCRPSCRPRPAKPENGLALSALHDV